MAKKPKVVEIKSVPTEPQRGAGEGADPNDPVGIYYPFGGIARLIGSLAGGDEDEAVIKTGGTIVEHDINVRYRAPAAGWTEVVNIEENNVQLSYDAQSEVYTAQLPISVLKNPASENQFINYEVSGDISLSGKCISYDGGGGNIVLVQVQDQDDIADFEVEVNVTPTDEVIVVIAFNNPVSDPSININIKISTVSDGTAANSGSEASNSGIE